MSKCKTFIDEVRFDTREKDLTHVYVFIRALGDCPVGITGWHYKAFSAKLSAVEIYQSHFKDFLLWPLKAPVGLILKEVK